METQKNEGLEKRYARSDGKCGWLYGMVGLTIIISLMLTACRLSEKPLIYRSGNELITFLEPNEPAPFLGVLITEKRHEYLLDCEDRLIQEGLYP